MGFQEVSEGYVKELQGYTGCADVPGHACAGKQTCVDMGLLACWALNTQKQLTTKILLQRSSHRQAYLCEGLCQHLGGGTAVLDCSSGDSSGDSLSTAAIPGGCCSSLGKGSSGGSHVAAVGSSGGDGSGRSLGVGRGQGIQGLLVGLGCHNRGIWQLGVCGWAGGCGVGGQGVQGSSQIKTVV